METQDPIIASFFQSSLSHDAGVADKRMADTMRLVRINMLCFIERCVCGFRVALRIKYSEEILAQDLVNFLVLIPSVQKFLGDVGKARYIGHLHRTVSNPVVIGSQSHKIDAHQFYHMVDVIDQVTHKSLGHGRLLFLPGVHLGSVLLGS